MKRFAPPLLAFIVLTAAMELAARFEMINAALVPPPSEILKTLIDLRADFAIAFFETAQNTFVGLGSSFALGFSIAVLLSLSPWLRKATLPFAIFFQTVPIIAIAPLLVIYFGFGAGTVIASSLIVSIFPVLASTLLGLQSVDPGELELFRLYKASRIQTLIHLRLPRAYPSIYAGVKIAIGLSVIGSVAGEFVAGGGLGALIDSARTQQRIDIVFGALILLSGLGLILIASAQFLNLMINKVRPYGLYLKD
jgi:NitT/TauT family transport system permease protein